MGIIKNAGRKTLGEIIIAITFFLGFPISALVFTYINPIMGILCLVFCIYLLYLANTLKKRK
ncbi:hypothetical protein HNP87_000706 [Methanococcus maripaludis]|uniref:Uncharacterized protein n=1 Tax=Methanococcus maripaludis TaxID=39152 RepID=A0A7J9NH46_METMI|nr:hypothetical protein [Methanococcus maripaludis]MBA2840194.1 hypothetical protein [Methanococcus maripaludis]